MGRARSTVALPVPGVIRGHLPTQVTRSVVHAAASYSSMSPPRIGRRQILPRIRSEPGCWAGRPQPQRPLGRRGRRSRTQARRTHPRHDHRRPLGPADLGRAVRRRTTWAVEDCRHLSRRLERDLLGAGECLARVRTTPPRRRAARVRAALQHPPPAPIPAPAPTRSRCSAAFRGGHPRAPTRPARRPRPRIPVA